MCLQVGVGVRNSVCAKNFIVGLRKSIHKAELHEYYGGVFWVQLLDFFVVRAGLVSDLVTELVPAERDQFVSVFRPKARSHSLQSTQCVTGVTYIIKQTVRLCKVHYVNANGPREVIAHTKGKPLQIGVAVRVVAHPDVVGARVTEPCLLNVGTLEIAVKSYDFCAGRLGLPVLEVLVLAKLDLGLGLPLGRTRLSERRLEVLW